MKRDFTFVNKDALGKFIKSHVPIAERFEHYIERIPECGCWIWTGATKGDYGCLTVNKKSISCHRLSWELFKGPIPDGMYVCHHCDTRLCVNPNHLFLGTHNDNMQDGVSKSRFEKRIGEKNTQVKLTKEQVLAIRNDPRKLPQIAKDYNIAVSTACQIRKRQRWVHL